MKFISPTIIDSLLPQTQCGLCHYGGCMPYAEAIAYEDAPLNLCPPGGVPTLLALGNLLQQDVSVHIPDMEKKAKPAMLAIIRENECIGCTKCIQACPVDAIIGSVKQMHTVISTECTGCELCIPACPVDCIDLIVTPEAMNNKKKTLARNRYEARQSRLLKEKNQDAFHKPKATAPTALDKKNYINEAIARAKVKKDTSTA